MCRYAKPTVDLVYFFGSSTDPEFREKHLEDLLKFYHDTLMRFLKSYGYDDSIYTYSDFKTDFIDCFPYGYSMGLLHAMVRLIIGLFFKLPYQLFMLYKETGNIHGSMYKKPVLQHLATKNTQISFKISSISAAVVSTFILPLCSETFLYLNVEV